MELKTWVGSTTDWEGFKAAQKERWKPPCNGSSFTRCMEHGTIFKHSNPLALDDEPCWLCLKEFTREL